MVISLRKAIFEDCPALHHIQVLSFIELLQKYNDFDSNPAAEDIDQIQQRFEQPYTDFYFILSDDLVVGMLRVCNFGLNCQLSPICILPEHRHKGYARRAILEMEKLYPEAILWQLNTIKQETHLCRLYEGLGYQPTGKVEHIKENMDFVWYEKKMF